MQSQDDPATLHYADSISIAAFQDLIKVQADRQRQEFIREHQPVQSHYGCISDISLAHFAAVPVAEIWPITNGISDSEAFTHQPIATEDVISNAKKQHCGCIEESTLDALLEESGINNRYDDDDWIQEQLLRNCAL